MMTSFLLKNNIAENKKYERHKNCNKISYYVISYLLKCAIMSILEVNFSFLYKFKWGVVIILHLIVLALMTI